MSNNEGEPIIIDISSGDEDEDVGSESKSVHEVKQHHSDETIISVAKNSSSLLPIGSNGSGDNQIIGTDGTRSRNDNNHVQMFMEVTGMSKDVAISELRKYHHNIDVCIAAHFDQKRNEDKGKKTEIEGQVGGPKQRLKKKSDVNLKMSPDTFSDIIAIAAKKSINLPVSLEYDQKLLFEPSKPWADTVKRCNELKVKFVDNDFPPNSTSLDGRRQQQQQRASKDPSTTTTTIKASKSSAEIIDRKSGVIRCRCGVPACVRTVQKDGPNYGRFYLACGKPKPRPRKRSVKRKRDKNSNDNHNDDGEKVVILDDEGKTSETKADGAADQKRKQKEMQCQFFQWDDNHTQSNNFATNRSFHHLVWFRFGTEHGHHLTAASKYSQGVYYSPDHVQQGAMGDCWFLSALAVVAEKPYLIQRLLPHIEFNEAGCYEVCFCLDGRFQSTLVDSFLPAMARKVNPSKKSRVGVYAKNTKRGGIQTNDENIVLQPAFAAGNISWPAIVEKAYAKVHGSYSRLSGGFISEAFYDLTGAPVERICFRKEYDYDAVFARLLSFSNAGFLMGIATNAGGDGLVSCHAYSLLGVYEVHGAVVGEQKKVTHFFNHSNDRNNDDVIFVKESRNETGVAGGNASGSTVRLVRIRNPWGVREWKGKWSAKSVEWTAKIRSDIGDDTCKQGDGTFFMSYEDMIQRFDHMDVAKCQEGWKRTSRGGAMKFHQTGDALFSCSLVYICQAKVRTWAFFSLVQRKKRANATTQFWYIDLSIIVLKRKQGAPWERCQCQLQGVKRACDCELFLDPSYEYCFIPFSFLSGREELEFGAQVMQTKKSAPFQFTSYSANKIDVRAEVRSSIGKNLPLESIHSSLLQMTKKVVHVIGPSAVLLTVNGDGCVYFLALNGGTVGVILNLKIEVNRGMAIVVGEQNATKLIPPKIQCVVLQVANDGRNLLSPINFSFKTEPSSKQTSTIQKNYLYRGIETKISLSLAGELFCSSSDPKTEYRCGQGSIDERLWSSAV